MKTRIVIVDDSLIVRQVLTRELSRDPDLEVVGTASDPYIARDVIVSLRPDVVTLDIEMPRMDGITFLKKLMRYFPIPIIIVSSLTKHGSSMAMDALHAGAVDVVAKPHNAQSIAELSIVLAEKIKAAAQVNIEKYRIQSLMSFAQTNRSTLALATISSKIIAIGASTGGTQAIEAILTQLPENTPPIVVVQHMPENFTKSFAERLDRICQISVKEGENGDALLIGRALVAPGNKHMLVKKSGNNFQIEIKDGPLVCRQRPAVDVTFRSVARVVGKKAIGVILTGMGNDGAAGMLEMKQQGAYNLAQDEATSIVYGMPKEAVKLGAVDKIVPLDMIPRSILAAL